MHVVWRVRGPQCARRFRAAIQNVVSRYDLLTSRVVSDDGHLYLERAPEWAFPERSSGDISSGFGDGECEQLHRMIARIVWTPFTAGLLFRPFVIELSAGDAVCGFVPHHAVMDYYGCQILAREIRGELTGNAEGTVGDGRERLQYADYVRGQVDWLAGSDARHRLEYWRECMRDAPNTCLPNAGHVEGTVSLLDCLPFELSSTLRIGLVSAARSCRSPMAAVIMAVNHVALAATLQRDDVVSRVVLSGRDSPALLSLVGNTVDCFPLRAPVNRQELFPRFAQQLHATFVRGCRHRVRWEAVKDVMKEVGAGFIAPSFNLIMQAECPAQSARATGTGSDVSLEPMHVRRPLELASASLHKSHHMGLFDTGQLVHGQIAYMPARHSKTSVEIFVERFLRYLTAIAEDPFVSVGRLMDGDWGRATSVASE